MQPEPSNHDILNAITTLTGEVGQLRENVSQLHAESQQTRGEIGQLRAESQLSRDELGQLRAESQQTRGEIGQLRAESKLSRDELGQLHSESQQSRGEIGNLQTGLSQLSEALGQFRGEVTQCFDTLETKVDTNHQEAMEAVADLAQQMDDRFLATDAKFEAKLTATANSIRSEMHQGFDRLDRRLIAHEHRFERLESKPA